MPSESASVELDHSGKRYRVTFRDGAEGARCVSVVRSGQYLDMYSPIAREVIAKARIQMRENGL